MRKKSHSIPSVEALGKPGWTLAAAVYQPRRAMLTSNGSDAIFELATSANWPRMAELIRRIATRYAVQHRIEDVEMTVEGWEPAGDPTRCGVALVVRGHKQLTKSQIGKMGRDVVGALKSIDNEVGLLSQQGELDFSAAGTCAWLRGERSGVIGAPADLDLDWWRPALVAGLNGQQLHVFSQGSDAEIIGYATPGKVDGLTVPAKLVGILYSIDSKARIATINGTLLDGPEELRGDARHQKFPCKYSISNLELRLLLTEEVSASILVTRSIVRAGEVAWAFELEAIQHTGLTSPDQQESSATPGTGSLYELVACQDTPTQPGV